MISETAKFAADLATSTPGDIVDPLQVTKDYPMLTAASQGIADTTPWGEGGWRGLVGRIEKDPAEWITDIALEATGAGIGYVVAKRGLKGTFDVLDKVLEAVPAPQQSKAGLPKHKLRSINYTVGSRVAEHHRLSNLQKPRQS